MRENIRLKQPFHLSLGVKQVVGALVASLVVLGAIFALGLGVGRKSGAPDAQPAGGSRDALARLDEPLAGKEEAAPELKAHQALTDSRAIEKTMPVPSANAVAKASAEEAPATEQEIVMPPPIAAPGPAPLPAAASQGRDLAPSAATPPGTPSGQAALPRDRAPGHAQRDQGSIPRAGAPARAAKVSSPSAKAAKPRPAAHASKANGKGAYTIQIASAQHRADAERVAKRVAARKPRIVAADVPGKGRWYRVQIGSYETRDSAKVALASMSDVHGIVTPAR